MGVILLMDAITGIIKSFKLKKLDLSRWWILLIINGIFLAFAVYIILNAKGITELLIRFIGGFLIADALVDLLMSLRISKAVKTEIRDIVVIENEK